MAKVNHLLHGLLFASGMITTDMWLHGLDAMPWYAWIRSKPAEWQQGPDRFDTVVSGTSRMHFGFVPAAFDARMGELGDAASTFNLAHSGFRMHDCIEMAHWVLDHRSSRLRRLVVELSSWDPGDPRANWMTDQSLQVHGLRQLWPRIRVIFGPGVTDRAAKLGSALAHTAANVLLVGQGPRLLDDLMQSARAKPLHGQYPVADAGFMDVEVHAWPANQRAHEALLANQAEADAWVAAKRLDRDPPISHGVFDLQSCRSLKERCADAGVELVFVVMPALGLNLIGRDSLPPLAAEMRVLDFDDPYTHPQLFALPLWYDRSHLAKAGAVAFSRQLADRLIALADKPFEAATGQGAGSAAAVGAPVLLVAWAKDGSNALEVSATNLPSTGTLQIAVSNTLPSAAPAAGPPVRLQQPLLRSWALPNSGQPTTAARFEAAALADDRELFAQLSVWVDNQLVASSDAVRIEPRR